LEIEHIVARAQGGSDRASNLCLACHTCNQKKANRPLAEFLKNDVERVSRILALAKAHCGMRLR
jgi:5-methylcytosine-specific restriction endonuclease McrA